MERSFVLFIYSQVCIGQHAYWYVKKWHWEAAFLLDKDKVGTFKCTSEIVAHLHTQEAPEYDWETDEWTEILSVGRAWKPLLRFGLFLTVFLWD